MPRLVAIHVAKGSRLPMRSAERVEVETAKGIVGDRYHGTRHRHVTLQSLDDLAEAARRHGAEVPPGLTRRNLTVSDGVVPREPGALVRLGGDGGVLLQVVRVAAPCKLLDDTIGPGAQDALRHRGGSVLRVLEGGVLVLGDEVDLDVAGSATPVTSTPPAAGPRGRLP